MGQNRRKVVRRVACNSADSVDCIDTVGIACVVRSKSRRNVGSGSGSGVDFSTGTRTHNRCKWIIGKIRNCKVCMCKMTMYEREICKVGMDVMVAAIACDRHIR